MRTRGEVRGIEVDGVRDVREEERQAVNVPARVEEGPIDPLPAQGAHERKTSTHMLQVVEEVAQRDRAIERLLVKRALGVSTGKEAGRRFDVARDETDVVGRKIGLADRRHVVEIRSVQRWPRAKRLRSR